LCVIQSNMFRRQILEERFVHFPDHLNKQAINKQLLLSSF
jgi:hypothetical protein